MIDSRTVPGTVLPTHAAGTDPLFAGPGEMRALCRALDWAATPLGPVAKWPLSLRTTVATLLASRHPMFLFWGPELVQVYNDAYRPSLGSGERHPHALGARGAEFWTEIWEIIGPQIAQVMGGGEATWHEDQLVPMERNGRVEEVYWTYSYGPAFDDAGRVGGVLVVCQETTARVEHTREHARADEVLRQSAAHDAFRVALADALRPLADPSEIQAEAAQLLGRHLGVSRAFYAEADGADHVIIQRDYADGVPSAAGRHALDDFGHTVAEAIRAGRTLAVADVAAEALSDAERAVFAAIAVRAHATVCLVKGGRLVALLGVHERSPRAWTADEVALIEEAAERTWAAVERARAEGALRRSEARARALIASFPGGAVFVVDRDLRYTLAEGDALLATGLRPSDLVGKTVFEALDPALAASYAPMYRRALGGEPFAHEHEAHGHVYVSRGVPLRDEAGAVEAVLAVSFDVTDRRRAEEAARASEARQAFLLGLSDRLRPLGDAEAIQFEAARALGERLGANRVGYAEIEPDGETSVVTHNYTDGVPGIEGRYRVVDYGPALLSELRAGRTVVRGDIARDPTLTDAERAAHAALGLGATVNVPLVKAGRLVAILFMHHRTAHAWSTDELSLLDAVAERTWDAVERARAEAALRASEAKYRTLFESMDQGFCVIEVLSDERARPVDYRFLEANPVFEQQTGLVSVLGRTARELVPGLETHWFETYGRVAATGEPARFQNGSEAMGRWFDVYAFRVGAPELRRVAVLFTDVSAAKAAERERERLLAEAQAARAEAEGANRAKSDFLAVMSHELRTPLNAIQGYAELMELGIHGPVTPEQREALRRIQTSQRHLLGLVNGVLNYARVETGNVDYHVVDVPLDEALATCEALIAPQARGRGLVLEFGGAAPDLVARADPEKLQQIVLNLLSNAVKFTEPGGSVALSCEAAGGPTGDAVLVRVRDTGRGIPAEQIARIFEPFVQVDARLTRTQEGTGLGLAISRDLARGMGGDLAVESALGEGSTFTLTLPRAG